ncbi:unnamed protein product [Vitrella brassicaformis CCMP3155]|uniref:Uncharacterized protein n=1 Tax=Vitrella brassicaformis (strain CCMP3155) TaxID=1169540 RepID=A0A0G4EL22_VITBC|nr:unnamed protein product [Vitrella brassicaformis CCMP3155]|eukprot:CEL97881.1 unnamed protein product [Vitrella brassicaformis CCMP3155]
MNEGNILLSLRPSSAIKMPFGIHISGKAGKMLQTEISAHNLQLIDLSRIADVTDRFVAEECKDKTQFDGSSVGRHLFGILQIMLMRTPADANAMSMMAVVLDPSKSCFVHSCDAPPLLIRQWLNTDQYLEAAPEVRARVEEYLKGVAQFFSRSGKDHRGYYSRHPQERRPTLAADDTSGILDWMISTCSVLGEETFMREMAAIALSGGKTTRMKSISAAYIPEGWE